MTAERALPDLIALLRASLRFRIDRGSHGRSTRRPASRAHGWAG
jgi:hypothetical protein